MARESLIVRGARQVGKTWLVEDFAAEEFESLVKIDLEKRRDLHVHFGDMPKDNRDVPGIEG